MSEHDVARDFKCSRCGWCFEGIRSLEDQCDCFWCLPQRLKAKIEFTHRPLHQEVVADSQKEMVRVHLLDGVGETPE